MGEPRFLKSRILLLPWFYNRISFAQFGSFCGNGVKLAFYKHPISSVGNDLGFGKIKASAYDTADNWNGLADVDHALGAELSQKT